jgi:hypothetical protein
LRSFAAQPQTREDGIKQIKNLGATWADIVWDFSRGYITFNKAATSNAVIKQLVDE